MLSIDQLPTRDTRLTHGYESSPSDMPPLEVLAGDAVELAMKALSPYGRHQFNALTWQDEGQAEGEPSHTFVHSAQTAALVMGALRHANASADTIEICSTAAAFHDLGKSEDEIRALMLLARPFTAEERTVMNAHGERGAVVLQHSLLSPQLERISRYVARRHWEPGLGRFSGDPTDYLWGYAALTQIADRAQALTLDWNRGYKPFRMTNEGLLDRQGRPVMERITAEIMKGHDPDNVYLGVVPRDLVRLAISYMPTEDFIANGVEKARRQHALAN